MELFTAVFSVDAKLECEQEPVDEEETHFRKNAQGSSWRYGAHWTVYRLCTLLQ